jgi:hypothetical protein
MTLKTSISGALLTALLNEADKTDQPAFGILYGSYQAVVRQIMSDTHENENLSESVLGMVTDGSSLTVPRDI